MAKTTKRPPARTVTVWVHLHRYGTGALLADSAWIGHRPTWQTACMQSGSCLGWHRFTGRVAR